jgi:hypothetical protein
VADEERGKYRWLARLAYAALAVALVSGLWRRISAKAPRKETPTFEVEPQVFSGPPAPPPLAAHPGAPRIVRWCQVRRLIERRCHRCHGAPTALGAPFPLVSYADTQRDYPSGSGRYIFERMDHVIRYRVMPPVSLPLDPPVLPLEQAEADLLLVWLEEGALALGGEECDPTHPIERAAQRPGPGIPPLPGSL